jgi:NAD(P)-dependent dehydrogenase (short-subunit alcohol dehydrogenase family)
MSIKEFDLSGRVAIVTGAGRGIGKAIALCFAETGADVVVAARTVSQIDQTCKEVEEQGRRCLGIPTDVTKAEEVERLVKETIERFGQVDILVNQVGGGVGGPLVPLPGYGGMYEEETAKPMSEEAWQQSIEANMTSVFLGCRAVGPFMIERRKGKIINVASFVAAKGFPYTIPYTTCKAGVTMFTRSLALEWARYNVNVNAIGPGYVPTASVSDMMEDPKRRERLRKSVPLGRFAEPREIALLALYLASPASDYVTGQTMYIDGGLLA